MHIARHSQWLSRYALLAVVCCLSACGGSDPVSSATDLVAPSLPTPDSDAFYAQPVPMPIGANGHLLDSRAVVFAPAGVPQLNQAWQIKFLSRDSKGRQITAIATVIKPLLQRAGGPVLLSHQFAEDSLGAQCAPSHAVTGSLANPIAVAETSKVIAALALGWTVVVPDHEGPRSAYEAGRLQGQITLDAIRAALSFNSLGLSQGTPIGLLGYSGGANPTAWAASYHLAYAPELNIVGVAAGGVAVDLINVARTTDTQPLNQVAFSLIFSAIMGINREYPELVTPYLNDKGRAAFESMKDGCVGLTTDGTLPPLGHFGDYTTTKDPLDAPSTRAIAPIINLPQPGHTPITDLFIYHVATDELLPVADVDKLVNAWCNSGVTVRYYRVVAGEHLAFDVLTAPIALTYLESRFDDTAPLLPPGTTVCNQ